MESNLYGEANTHGYSTLKAEEGEDVAYDAESAAVLTLSFAEGTEIDDSKIDSSNACVTLEEGDAYYVNDLIFNGTSLEGSWENGQFTYHLQDGDFTWNNFDYPVENGGMEWSCIGGDGNGHYVFNLSVSGIQYDGVEVEPAQFRAEVYIYGREFSSRKSPSGEEKPLEEQGNGAAGYDDLVLPEAAQAELEEKPEAADTAVWTWVGDGEKPIVCDYLTDNFYVTWPEGTDASALESGDVQVVMYSQYGDEYVMTPDEEYTVYASAEETQISVNMVYWPFAPVYTTMELTVNPEKVEGVSEAAVQSYDIASVYTHMVPTGMILMNILSRQMKTGNSM
ncbi:MAG: hypothetical protein Q4F41_03995 [Eubacteriales bacterium]|nr:hypothetical protein [Eubacteriales bacterium]